MTNNNHAITEVFRTLFSAYQPGVTLDATLSQALVDYAVAGNLDEAAELVQEIDDAASVLLSKHRQLQQAKAEGRSRGQWFQSELEQISQAFALNPSELAGQIAGGLKAANHALVEGITPTAEVTPVHSPSFAFEGLNKVAVTEGLLHELKTNSLLAPVLHHFSAVGQQLAGQDAQSPEIPALKAFFDSDWNGPEALDTTKIATTGLLIARKKGWLPELPSDSPIFHLVHIADQGLRRTKVSYKMGAGLLNPFDACEKLLDHTTSVASAAIIGACEKTGQAIGGKVGAAIGSIFGPAGTVIGTRVGQVAGRFAGKYIGERISEGVRKIGEKSKEMLSSAKEWVNSKMEGMRSAASKFFSSLF